MGEVRLEGTLTVSENKALQKWMGKEMFDFSSACSWRLRARVCRCKSFRKDLELDSDKTVIIFQIEIEMARTGCVPLCILVEPGDVC